MTQQATMYSGDSKTLTVLISDAQGAPVDVSDAQAITYGVFGGDGSAKVTKTLADGIAVDEATVTVELAPADTAELLGGEYIHELQLVTAAGAVYTVLQGKLTIRRDYIE